MSDSLRKTTYTTIDECETITIELPHGIGSVHIRTGNVEGRTGDPVIAIEVVSDTLDTPAFDGRYYEEKYDPMTSTVRLVGRQEGDTT